MEIPDWLMEMSQQMNEQPNRCTAHPIWQVRCKRLIPCPSSLSDRLTLVDCDGEFYDDEHDECLNSALMDRYFDWCKKWEAKNGLDFIECYDHEDDDLPYGCEAVWVQEVEEVVTTHLTQHDAEWFIQRKQHDYPKLYTYVESAYWSPQLKQLQDWIKSLNQPTKEND